MFRTVLIIFIVTILNHKTQSLKRGNLLFDQDGEEDTQEQDWLEYRPQIDNLGGQVYQNEPVSGYYNAYEPESRPWTNLKYPELIPRNLNNEISSNQPEPKKKLIRRRRPVSEDEPVKRRKKIIKRKKVQSVPASPSPDYFQTTKRVEDEIVNEYEAKTEPSEFRDQQFVEEKRRQQHKTSATPNPAIINDLVTERNRFLRPKTTASTTTTTTPAPENRANNRTLDESRFLSLFTIVSFRNEGCISTSGNNGTCYSSADCSNLGGAASGSCAQGFGVCCLFVVTCGSSTSTNCTYFQNTGYPSVYNQVGSCQVTINKINSNICQLRLDFENMVLAQPEATDNICQTDQFIVSGAAPIPAICGTNSGQHMYVDIGQNNNSPIVLTAVTGSSTFDRSFSVKTSQIECSATNRASDGCLQYHTGVQGQIQSFNYLNAAGLQISNTDYTVCVRMERGFCGIQYTACTDNTNTIAMSFSITGSTATPVGSIVGTDCSTDWITIPCATNTNDPNAQNGTPTTCVDRICGMVFNSVTTAAGTASVPVSSFIKPFNINVHTSPLESTPTPAETDNRGFCLDYVQQPCTVSG